MSFLCIVDLRRGNASKVDNPILKEEEIIDKLRLVFNAYD